MPILADNLKLQPMVHKILLCATALLLFLTACAKTPFDADNVRRLANLHDTEAEYTASEIKEVEAVMESFVVKQEKLMNDILNEKDAMERQRKIVKMAAEYKSEADVYDSIGLLVVLLRDSKHSDKTKFKNLMKRMLEVQYSVDIIMKEI